MLLRVSIALAACALGGGCDYIFRLDEVPPVQVPDAAVVEGRWQQISAGDGFTCAIALDGTLWCWGRNYYGQLGVGDEIERTRPTQVIGQPGATWSSVTAGDLHACAIDDAGGLWCWGDNSDGALGVPGDDSVLPQRVGTGTWQAASAGDAATCAIDSAGLLWCWGNNDTGMLGVGDFNDRDVPTLVDTTQTWSTVSVGGEHSCAIRSDGRLYCWGANYWDQLGTGSSSSRIAAPAAVVSAGTWTRISAGMDQTCGITSMGEAQCWGRGRVGVLGTGSGNDVAVPLAVMSNARDWEELLTGETVTCGRRTDRSMWCWGDAAAGPLTVPSSTPVEVMPAGTVETIAVGRTHVCRLSGAAAWCTGDGSVGQLGDGQIRSTLVPAQVTHPAGWLAVAAGSDFTCALDGNFVVHCWGANGLGGVGDGTYYRRVVPTPVSWTVSPTSPLKQLAASDTHACVLDGAGKPWCWGTVYDSGLGDGSSNGTQLRPVGVTGTAFPPLSSLVAGEHTCGVTSANDAWCWGPNDYGELGLGENTSSPMTAVKITTLQFKQIAAGDDHTCGIDAASGAADRVVCWGRNARGQLGTGTTTNSLTPAATSGSGAYAAVFAGFDRTCAITTAGASYCWGTNYYQSASTSNALQLTVPTPAPAPDMWRSFALGDDFTCAIDTTSHAFCWGRNQRGQLGDGTQTRHQTPVAVGESGSTWAALAAGEEHVCGLRQDNSLWCWGSDRNGQLGLGTAWETNWVQAP